MTQAESHSTARQDILGRSEDALLPKHVLSEVSVTSATPRSAHAEAVDLLDRLARKSSEPCEPFDQACALAELDLLPRAISLLTEATGERILNKHRSRLAEWHIGLGDASGARQWHDRVKTERLTHNGRIHQALIDIDLVNLEQGAGPALQRSAEASAAFPEDRRLMLRHLELLSAVDLTGADYGPAAARAYAATRSPALLRKMVDFALRRNQHALVMPFLADMVNQEPRNAFMIEKSINIAWIHQDATWLERLLSAASELDLPPNGLIRFAEERAGAFAPFRAFLEAQTARIAALPACPEVNPDTLAGLCAKATLSGLLGEPARGLVWVDAVLARYPFMVRARLIRARLEIALNRVDEAEADLDVVLVEAPHLPETYRLRFETLNRHADSIAEIDRLLDRRATHVPRFRQGGQLAPLHTYDIERFQLEMRRGRPGKALLYRSGRGANELLAHLFPDSYQGPARPALSPGRQLPRTGVIAIDGISDEIRWARNYRLIDRPGSSVMISCEPRLEGLMRRSFPSFEVVPLPRRWLYLWGEQPLVRPGVPERHLSGVLDEDYLQALTRCGLIFFADELTCQLELHHPELAAPHAEAIAEGYLRPDPARLARCHKRLEAARDPRPRVGLLWRSAVRSHQRNRHYLDITDLLPLLKAEAPVRFVSLQSALDPEETAFCQAHGIEILPEVDLHDDLEEVAALCSTLDLVIGVSTLPFEMAAAVGTPVWMFATSAHGLHQRRDPLTEDRDQLTLNGRLIVPSDAALAAGSVATIPELVLTARDRLLAWAQDGARHGRHAGQDLERNSA